MIYGTLSYMEPRAKERTQPNLRYGEPLTLPRYDFDRETLRIERLLKRIAEVIQAVGRIYTNHLMLLLLL